MQLCSTQSLLWCLSQQTLLSEKVQNHNTVEKAVELDVFRMHKYAQYDLSLLLRFAYLHCALLQILVCCCCVTDKKICIRFKSGLIEKFIDNMQNPIAWSAIRYIEIWLNETSPIDENFLNKIDKILHK